MCVNWGEKQKEMLYWNGRSIKVLIFLLLLDAEYFTFNSLSRGTQYVYCLSQYSVEYFITHQFVETGYLVSVIFSQWLINKQKKKSPFIMNFLFSAFILEIIKPLFHSCVCIMEDWGGGGGGGGPVLPSVTEALLPSVLRTIDLPRCLLSFHTG